jgi:hypothetical protein
LSGHCKRAEEARERERERPFDSPAMAAVIEDSAKARAGTARCVAMLAISQSLSVDACPFAVTISRCVPLRCHHQPMRAPS